MSLLVGKEQIGLDNVLPPGQSADHESCQAILCAMKQFTVQRLVILTCLISVLVRVSKYLPSKILSGWVLALALGGLALLACAVSWLIFASWRLRRQNAENRFRADEWKRRICAVAENTDFADYGTDSRSFDDVCGFEDDDFLGQIVKELEAMPRGERVLLKAYKVVHGRVYDD